MSEKKGIVLNRMYTGRYLSKNLGHEVINMFADDEGDRYLYLNATGDFSAEHVGNIGSMLLIKYAGQDKDGKPWVEVLGCATGLKDIYNPKQRKQSEKDCVPSKGNSFKRIKDIKYGGVPIHYIFDGSEQQDVLISYYAEKLLVPKNDVKIYLSFAPFGDHTTQTSKISSDSGRYVVEMVEKFASTSLKRYILEKDNKEDFDSLNKLMSLDIWTEAESEKITIHKSFKPHQISLFDIMPKLQNDENCFSDALGYFIDRDRYEWQQILQKICQDNNLGKIIYVKREKDATISKDNKGGRIDLLIRTDNAYIVIENKIKSDINRVQGDSRGKNQLDRYIEYIKHSIEGHAEIKSYFFILAPDYNMPDAEERKGYKPLYYSTLVGKHQKDVDNAGVVEMMKQYNEIHKNENLWSAFYDAMTRHSFDHENDSLYEDMKNTFFTRIQECSKKITMPKYFTKSAFAMSLECPRRLYYAYDKDVYANQDVDDEFLRSLAEGGFQVGEFAKLCYGIGAANNIKTLEPYDAVRQTKELLSQEDVNIAEAAFLVGNMFVRADIIEKKGDVINLIEVKAKSWNSLEDTFVSKNGKSTNKAIRSYLYDVAFQKYVLVQALKEMFPAKNFKVNAFLMLADKSRNATVNGLNQLFKIKTDSKGKSYVEAAANAAEVISNIPVADRVVRPFDVDDICDRIIAGDYAEQQDPEFMLGGDFVKHVEIMSNDYCNHIKTDCVIGSKCFACPFHRKADDSSDKHDGYCECWIEKAGFDPSATTRPLIKDMSGQYISKDKFVKEQKFYMEDLTDADLKRHGDKKHCGLDHYERKWLHIGVATGNEEVLKDYRTKMNGDAYLDIAGLKDEMKNWEFPLHFIDFETSAVALPFYDKMRPYEQIAFQFSHHRVDRNDDGTYKVTHAGQFINTEQGHFPNFDFIRALKAELDKDEGTIFRYSNHENTILREIHRQLDARNEPDKKELQDFIDSITHYEEDKLRYVGVRDMVDLADVVLKYYFHPIMGGSYSIKVVLPSVLNSSEFIKSKYSQPIYGTLQMPSQNLSEAKVWIDYGEDGKVKNPYKLLPPIASYLGLDADLNELELKDTESVANGGAALAAYAKMQFSDAAMSEALEKALLTYCELDTLAMVFIWEYFHNECNK